MHTKHEKHENAIGRIKIYLLEKLKSDLRGAWIAANQTQIDKLANQYQIRYEDEILKTRSPKQKILSTQDRETCKTRSDTKATEDYINQFNNEHWEKFEKNFSARFDSLKLDNVLDKFLKRHPWLDKFDDDQDKKAKKSYLSEEKLQAEWKSQLENNNLPIPYLFIESYAKQQLCHVNSTRKSQIDTFWRETGYEEIVNQKFEWKNSSEEEINKIIEGYPLTDIAGFYKINRPEFSKLLFEDYQRNSSGPYNFPTDTKDRQPHYVDLFRFLNNYCLAKENKDSKEKMVAQKNENNILSTKYAPFHIDELTNLTNYSRWNEFNILFVNVAPIGETPLWCILHKKNRKWIAYVDATLFSDEQLNQLQILMPKGTIIDKSLDYKNNLALNDIENIAPITAWHSILLGRIFPWCDRGEKIGDLQDYRKDVPWYALYQYVLESCACHKFTIDGINTNFHNRTPFTNSGTVWDKPKDYAQDYNRTINPSDHLISSKTLISKEKGYEPLKAFYHDAKVDFLLNAFDSGNLTVSDKLKTLRLNFNPINDVDKKSKYLLNALQVVYHSSIEHLIMPYPYGVQRENNEEEINKLNKQLFDCDVNLKTISPPHGINYENFFNDTKEVNGKQVFTYPMHCAARNRFLETVAPQLLDEAKKNIKKRKELWKSTGNEIIAFFQKSNQCIDLDCINNYVALDKKWRQTFCDHTKKNDLVTPPIWGLAQISKMGITGLDVLFEALESYTKKDQDDKDAPPNLPAIFDLNGGLTDQPGDYIRELTKKIREFDVNKPDCAPLFSSLSLILPDPLDWESKDNLKALIIALDMRSRRYPQEFNEINLHNLPNGKEGKELLNMLLELTNPKLNNLQIQINIPEWNRNAFMTIEEQKTKAAYRNLQNQIAKNRCVLNNKNLLRDTQNIYECVKGTLGYELMLEEKLENEQHLQVWKEDPNQFYVLTGVSEVQHQVDQQVEQEHEKEQEKEHEKDVEEQEEEQQEQEVREYVFKERDFITRDNITRHEKFLAILNNLVPDSKDFFNHSECFNQKDLTTLFSLLVGSKQNGLHIIEKIQPQAMQEILEHLPQFLMNIAKDNPTAGFFLAYDGPDDKSLVLCFSETLKKKTLSLKQRNPFTVQLHTPKKAEEFRGDYRQLDTFTDDNTQDNKIEIEQTLWRYLAIEDADEIRIKNEKELLDNLLIQGADSNKSINKTMVEAELSSVVLQHYNVEQQIKFPQEYEACLNYLADWAKKNNISDNTITAFFNKGSSTCLTKDNLKAFGQLFNTHDVSKDRIKGDQKNGTQHWLVIADQMQQAFPKHIKIWKTRLLDRSKNWSEYLTKDEVDAVALSIATLKKHPAYTDLWWQFLDTHGEVTGHMHYADLWYSFQAIIKRINNNNKLTINYKAFSDFLENSKRSKRFHGQVFLDRLNTVLKNTNSQLGRDKIQQDILDNIDKIDWNHNGFYYANRYQSYPYWDEELQLTQFTSTSLDTQSASYQVKWDAEGKCDEPILQVLRFASQRMQLPPTAYEKFKTIVKDSLVIDAKDNVKFLRLFSASLAIGVDELDNFTADILVDSISQLRSCSSELIDWFNKQLMLDNQLIPNQLKMAFNNIALFIQEIERAGLTKNILKLSYPDSLEFINVCGRAMQYVDLVLIKDAGNKEVYRQEAFRRLLEVVKNNGWKHPLVKDYPWLVCKEESKPWDTSWQDPLSELQIDSKIHSFIRSEIKEQLTIFRQQLNSIDFSKTYYLPSYKDLSEIYKTITKSIEGIVSQQKVQDGKNEQYLGVIKETLRKARMECVTKLKFKGCAITYEKAFFKKLENNEVDTAISYFCEHSNENFKEDNLELYQILLKNYVAVAIDVDSGKQWKELFDIFIKIDNKDYYNDLGQVLGMLLSKAKANGEKRYYSVPQLTAWLKCLCHAQNTELHYPVTLLNEILDHALEENSTLLNQDLSQLGKIEDVAINQQNAIQNIVASSLPIQHKPALVELVIKDQKSISFIEKSRKILTKLHEQKASSKWIAAVTELIGVITKFDEKIQARVLEIFTRESKDIKGFATDNEVLKKLWQSTQIKLIKQLVAKKNITQADLRSYDTATDAYIAMIAFRAISNWNDNTAENTKQTLNNKLLSKLDEKELLLLTEYYASKPYPSAKELIDILENNKFKKAKDIIHHFETITQATDVKGESKRHYSITKDDKANLMRVLAGLKRKTDEALSSDIKPRLLNLLYYANHYSQVTQLGQLDINDLMTYLYQARDDIQRAGTRDIDAKYNASARLLACMREVLLRKTGKWANHTQMLDLLYAAMYDKNNLLHQVRTGEGKSIITLMGTAYLALNDNVVDLFSYKPSLSKRDHKEFSHVLDTLKINHGRITFTKDSLSDSVNITEQKGYKTYSSQQQGVGAINYATVPNLSLFFQLNTWIGHDSVSTNLGAEGRIAWVDECDRILEDKTLFNLADNRDNNIYNMDEWVYRATYQFYLDNKDSFTKTKEGHILIYPHKELKALYDYLQKRSSTSPKQSTFLQKYILPALTNDKKAINKRDQALAQLLNAANTAYGFNEGIEYCISPGKQKISGDMWIDTRVAKVISGYDNQMQENSTYSDLVQQFLHQRLNNEARARGEAPNFFVPPYTEIALTLDTPSCLKNFYKQINGCSSTISSASLDYYESMYGIDDVIKLPTHETLKTNFLPSAYCESEDAQVAQIIDHIRKSNQRPILITCKNDRHVKQLAEKIKAKLLEIKFDYSLDQFTVDTNDQGIEEGKIADKAGQSGKVTISSRMGRGTDIKPESLEGLMVIRTYPASPSIVKQEHGRQGRNGVRGTCQDIIDYSNVLRLVNEFETSSDEWVRKRFEAIYREQSQHLDNKLVKHEQKGSTKWDWIKEKDAREKYLNVRVTEQLKEELHKKQTKYLEAKNDLVTSLSGNVMDALRKIALNKTINQLEHKTLCNAWLDCYGRIKTAWNIRLKGKESDNDEIYELFLTEVDSIWGGFCSNFSFLDKKIVQTHEEFFFKQRSKKDKKHQKPQQATILTINKMNSLIDLYQQWIIKSDKHYFLDGKVNSNVVNAVFGEMGRGLELLYNALLKYNTHRFDQEGEENNNEENKEKDDEILGQDDFIPTWLKIIQKKSAHAVSCQSIAKTIDKVLSTGDKEKYNHYLSVLDTFFDQNWLNEKEPSTLLPKDITNNSLLLTLIMEISPKYFKQNDAEGNKAFLTFVTNFSEVIQENFSGTTQQGNKSSTTFEVISDDLEQLFSHSEKLTKLLVSYVSTDQDNDKNKDKLRVLVQLIKDNNFSKSPYKKNQLNQLINHLGTFIEKLEDTQELILPLFKLALVDSDVDPRNNYLPLPSDFPLSWSTENKYVFINFLSQRAPIKEIDCKDLIKTLDEFLIKDQREFDEVFRLLNDFPPYVPIDYIQKHLIEIQDGQIVTPDLNKLKEIKEASDKLSKVMQAREVITTVSKDALLKRPEKPKEFEQYMTIFTTRTPKDNKKLFAELFNLIEELIKFLVDENPQLKPVKKVTSKFLENEFKTLLKTTENRINKPLIEADKEKNNSEDDMGIEIIDEGESSAEGPDILEAITTDMISAEIDHLHTFTTLMKDSKCLLNDGIIKLLFERWTSSKYDKDLIKNSLLVIKKIQKFDRNYSSDGELGFSLLNTYLAGKIDTNTNERYGDFFTVLEQQKKFHDSTKPLSQEVILAVCRGYFLNNKLASPVKKVQLWEEVDNEKNSNQGELEKTFDILSKVVERNQKGQIVDYFYRLNQKDPYPNNEERTLIMQYLYHGFLNLHEKCDLYYIEDDNSLDSLIDTKLKNCKHSRYYLTKTRLAYYSKSQNKWETIEFQKNKKNNEQGSYQLLCEALIDSQDIYPLSEKHISTIISFVASNNRTTDLGLLPSLNPVEECKNKWFTYYEKFAEKLIKETRTHVNPDFMKFMGFTKELREVVEPPFTQGQFTALSVSLPRTILKRRSEEEDVLGDNTTLKKNSKKFVPQNGLSHPKELTSIYRSYIAKQRKRYKAYWWKSEARTGKEGQEGHADMLFKGLSKRMVALKDGNVDKAMYYENALKHILETQQKILTDDLKVTGANSKGYSRLFNISMEMFLQIAGYLLIDKEIAFENKQQILNDLLSGQLTVQLKQFEEALKEINCKIEPDSDNDSSNSNIREDSDSSSDEDKKTLSRKSLRRTSLFKVTKNNSKGDNKSVKPNPFDELSKRINKIEEFKSLKRLKRLPTNVQCLGTSIKRLYTVASNLANNSEIADTKTQSQIALNLFGN